MRRRQFIAWIGIASGALIGAWPLPALALEPGKVRRVGIIVEGIRSPAYEGFLQGMADRGYVSGQDYLVEWRFVDGSFLRTLSLVQDLEKLGVDVIFLGSQDLVYPVRQATRTIPIVMGYATDPIGNGFVNNLAHPGGNITGLASPNQDTSGLQLTLLSGLVPKLTRIALLLNPDEQSSTALLASMQAATQAAGLALVPLEARNAKEIDVAFARLADERVDAIRIGSDRFFLTQQQVIAERALALKLPSLFADREYVESGGLMSFADSRRDFYRRAAGLVDKIFHGTRPGDLAIERPALFELVINRKTARALGLTVPEKPDVADYELIE